MDVSRRIELEDGVDLLLPRLKSRGSQPMSQEVGFLDSPFALERVDCKAC